MADFCQRRNPFIANKQKVHRYYVTVNLSKSDTILCWCFVVSKFVDNTGFSGAFEFIWMTVQTVIINGLLMLQRRMPFPTFVFPKPSTFPCCPFEGSLKIIEILLRCLQPRRNRWLVLKFSSLRKSTDVYTVVTHSTSQWGRNQFFNGLLDSCE